MARRAAWAGGEKIPLVVYIFIDGNVLCKRDVREENRCQLFIKIRARFFSSPSFYSFIPGLPDSNIQILSNSSTPLHAHTYTPRMTGYATKPRNFVNWFTIGPTDTTAYTHLHRGEKISLQGLSSLLLHVFWTVFFPLCLRSVVAHHPQICI